MLYSVDVQQTRRSLMKRTLLVPLIETQIEYEALFFAILETDFTNGHIVTVPEQDDMNALICQKLLGLDEKSYAALAINVPETTPDSSERVALYNKHMRTDEPLRKQAGSYCIAIINAVIEKYNALIVK